MVSFGSFSREIGSSDIAGITYNADIINKGLLPFRDSLEIKSPAPYYLFAGIFKFIARDIRAVRVVLALWLLLGAAGVWAAAAALYENRLSRALAAGLFLCSVAHFDINYSSWLVTPYVWTFAALLWALETGS